MTDLNTPFPGQRLAIAREMGADRLNVVVNHPDVRPWLGGEGELDMSAAVADPANILLMNEFGGCFFERVGAGIYEVHTQFTPECRGAKVIRAVQDALRFMFTRTDCFEVQTKVPANNAGALGLVRAIGGDLQFTRDAVWPAGDGMVACGFYVLTIASWAGKCDAVMASGEWFHDKLEAAKIAKGASSVVHEDDAAHDRYVGATVEMILNGQEAKALWFYNRWARFSGYAQVAQIAADPVVIDIQDAIISIQPNNFEVLVCR